MKKNKPIRWKTNVSLPDNLIKESGGRDTAYRIQKALYVFWNECVRQTALNNTSIDQIYHLYADSDGNQHTFKVVDMQDEIHDKDDTGNEAYIRVNAIIECHPEQKTMMITKTPLEFSLKGKLRRVKSTGEIQSIQFTSLQVDDGVVATNLFTVA